MYNYVIYWYIYVYCVYCLHSTLCKCNFYIIILYNVQAETWANNYTAAGGDTSGETYTLFNKMRRQERPSGRTTRKLNLQFLFMRRPMFYTMVASISLLRSHTWRFRYFQCYLWPPGGSIMLYILTWLIVAYPLHWKVTNIYTTAFPVQCQGYCWLEMGHEWRPSHWCG